MVIRRYRDATDADDNLCVLGPWLELRKGG